MTLGNLGAMVQDNVKRLLAYSSIAHAGYLLVAFAASPGLGTSAAMFYTAAYAAMNVGAFAVVSHFANAGERYVTLEDYEGLGRSSPLLAATLTIFLLSLIGIPMTGGFFAKFYVFSAARESQFDLAYHHRRPQQRRRRILLPAHHRRDVHARIAEGSSGDPGSARASAGNAQYALLRLSISEYFPARVCSMLKTPLNNSCSSCPRFLLRASSSSETSN